MALYDLPSQKPSLFDVCLDRFFEGSAAESGEDRVELWRQDPVLWFEERLGVDRRTLRWSEFGGPYERHNWDGDVDPLAKALEALAGWRNVGVESGTSTGKTFVAAGAKLWFLDCWENSQVITLAPKADQLKLHLWKETGRFWERFKVRHPFATLQTLKVRMRGDPRDESWSGTGFPVSVRADEDAATKAQGFHAEHMLFIIEEGPGVEGPIYKTVVNTCTAPHNLILALGNPDNVQDQLHKFCEKRTTIRLRVSAYDHPNVVLDDASIIPGAVSEKSILDRAEDEGEDAQFFQSRVRGICPAQAADALIKLDWIRAAYALAKKPELREGLPAMGVDVANSINGDKASIAKGLGAVMTEQTSFQCPRADILGVRVATEAKASFISPESIGVDGIGVGASTINKLLEIGWTVQNLCGGARPVATGKQEQFNNLRSQMYWQVKLDLQSGKIGIETKDEELEKDLMAPRYTHRGAKIIVESKDDLKKRLGRSPDKGDAFVYWNWVRGSHGASSGQSDLVAI